MVAVSMWLRTVHVMAVKRSCGDIDRLVDDLLTTPATARDVAQRLERRLRSEPLRRFERIWQVSPSQAAAVFGVSRQAYAKWSRSVPADRLATVALLDETTEMLLDRLKVERIPAAVRRPSEMLGGLSLLDLAQQQRFTELRDAVQSIFDIARVQP
jgi:hypothetical protein